MIVENDNAPDTYVKESVIEGYGLFASKNFQKGDLVLDYNLFPESWYQTTYENLSEFKKEKSSYITIDENYCLTSDKISKFRYLNHSREANCICDFDKRKIFALRDIQKDEEILVDYRREYDLCKRKAPDWV